MSENELKLKKVIATVFKINVSDVNDDSSVDTVELWDSLNHLNLVLAIESEFNISLSEDQAVEIMSYPLIKIILNEHGINFGK